MKNAKLIYFVAKLNGKNGQECSVKYIVNAINK